MTRSAAGRFGRPPRTSRAEILTAANEVIERDGWEKLTIRKLAAEIGISPTTIYHHVRDREDLLVQLINDQAGQLERPELAGDPRQRIITAGTAMHGALAGRPWVAEVVTTDGFLSRVGESAAWYVEAIVVGALDAGCTPEEAILVFRNLWYYTVGEILVRAKTGARPKDGEVPSKRDQLFTTPDPSIATQHADRLPHLAAIGQLWVEVAARDTYTAGLTAFVNGLLPDKPAPRRKA